METPFAQLCHSGAQIRQLEPGLYSALPGTDAVSAPYDSRAALYDRMVSSDLYLRLAWGARRGTILSFMQAAFGAADGVIVDLTAGSAVDAAQLYCRTRRPVLVVDLSLTMLRKGMSRVQAVLGGLPSNLLFLQADALNLPLQNRCISTLLCHGGFHLLPDLGRVMSEWQRVLNADGSLYITSLVTGRSFGDAYLRLLHRAGEISPPRSPGEFETLLTNGLGQPLDVTVEGNFAYARTGADKPAAGPKV